MCSTPRSSDSSPRARPVLIDDITLSAFVDNQVDTVRAEMIIQAMEENLEIRERIYQFRRADAHFIAYAVDILG